jgi:hypothetical protein
VRQFRIGADAFAELQRGEAIIYSTLDGRPQRASVLRTSLPKAEPERIGTGERHACEIAIHPAASLEQLISHDRPIETRTQPETRKRRSGPEQPQLELFTHGSGDRA